jgi:hypothetical protein
MRLHFDRVGTKPLWVALYPISDALITGGASNGAGRPKAGGPFGLCCTAYVVRLVLYDLLGALTFPSSSSPLKVRPGMLLEVAIPFSSVIRPSLVLP